MALIAGLTVGVGPAAAASSTAQPTAIAKQSAPRADRVVGYYRTLGLCLRVGRIGEFRGRWDDFDCYRIRWGFHRGWWALEAQWNDWHDHGWPGDHHGWPGDDHHGWPGGPGGGGPGGGGPGGGGPGGGGPGGGGPGGGGPGGGGPGGGGPGGGGPGGGGPGGGPR